jgi:hypothetical protein
MVKIQSNTTVPTLTFKGLSPYWPIRSSMARSDGVSFT